jgi:ribonuclease III
MPSGKPAQVNQDRAASRAVRHARSGQADESAPDLLRRTLMNQIELDEAERLIGYHFNDPALLKRALTHASLADSRLDSNERLEFLGDSVLGLVICQYLFENFTDLLEGEMTKIKSMVVSRQLCAQIAEQLGLADLLRLGKGMPGRNGLPGSVTAAVYEALIGALYLDGGLEAAREFILRDMIEHIDAAFQSGHQSNFKSVLQQLAQMHFNQTPQYVVLDEKGPDHAKCFEVCVEIGATRYPSSWGASKKQAEQKAALRALVEMGHAVEDDNGEVTLGSGE